MVAPWERFRLAASASATVVLERSSPHTTNQTPTVTRLVGDRGTISFATVPYKAGKWLAGETIEVVCDGRLVHLWRQGVLVATHARRHKVADEARAQQRNPKTRKTAFTPRPAAP